MLSNEHSYRAKTDLQTGLPRRRVFFIPPVLRAEQPSVHIDGQGSLTVFVSYNYRQAHGMPQNRFPTLAVVFPGTMRNFWGLYGPQE